MARGMLTNKSKWKVDVEWLVEKAGVVFWDVPAQKGWATDLKVDRDRSGLADRTCVMMKGSKKVKNERLEDETVVLVKGADDDGDAAGRTVKDRRERSEKGGQREGEIRDYIEANKTAKQKKLKKKM
jgi:hypothetical protein